MSRSHVAPHRSDPGARILTPNGVARYYDDKTLRILAKYGPGPRVHFHTGLHAPAPRPGAPLLELRRAMVDAQEALLAHVRRSAVGAEVLDVGCGLGGGALYWAEQLGARVTAITNVAHHVEIVAAMAARANASGVQPLLRDAHALSGLGPFDCAIAIESSCYFDRARWFAELAKAMAPGAEVHVVDCFVADAEVAPRFDGYWKTRIGSRRRYEVLARYAGFEPVRTELLNDAVDGFWSLSRAWGERMLAGTTSAAERERLRRSVDEHAWLQGAIRSRAIEYAYASYRRL